MACRRNMGKTAIAWSAVFLLFCTPVAVGDDAPQAQAAAEPSISTWSGFVQDLAVSLVPENHVDERHWDKKETITSGVRIRTKSGRVRFTPREKKVNHGFWRKASVKLLKPKETFHVEIRNPRPQDDGSTRFDLFVEVRARCEMQFAWWAFGVKGLNGTVESDVTLQAIADCSFRVETQAKADQFLPALVLKPQIYELDLKLTDIDARQIGLIGGDAADQIGNASRETVEDILQSQEPKLLKQFQKRLEKNQDKMQIDLGDWPQFGSSSKLNTEKTEEAQRFHREK